MYVDPDERFMIVAMIGRADAMNTAEGIYPRADLYVEAAPRGRGPRCDISMHRSTARPTKARLSCRPTDKFLYFMSERGAFTEHGALYDAAGLERALHAPGNGLGDIYRVDFKATGIGR